ncbi:DUF6122 family protein [Tahibacter amnicola]|uniref:DUF6122 family protein n=1 Tax=Tahibacter amnicola TaxID=2976241 RepID=A0ABY6BSE4_9GAMM|nr:DUF6122 family protein [Tahibacter amnicola]UXI70692.1 DUF6122 family protein [Tahibacter amnicola]
MARPTVHIVLHVVVPWAVAWWGYRSRWRQCWLWLLVGWLIDVDHLLAESTYVPDRCSIGFHPLHTVPAAVAYLGLTAWQRTRWLGLGLCIHVLLDALDCIWMAASHS